MSDQENQGTCAIHGEFEKRQDDRFTAFQKSMDKTEKAILGAASDIKGAVKTMAVGEARLKALEVSDAKQWTAINNVRRLVWIGLGLALAVSAVAVPLTAAVVTRG